MALLCVLGCLALFVSFVRAQSVINCGDSIYLQYARSSNEWAGRPILDSSNWDYLKVSDYSGRGKFRIECSPLEAANDAEKMVGQTYGIKLLRLAVAEGEHFTGYKYVYEGADGKGWIWLDKFDNNKAQQQWYMESCGSQVISGETLVRFGNKNYPNNYLCADSDNSALRGDIKASYSNSLWILYKA